jgi:tRNA (Thr-GGU) A37 N-methylase
MAALLPKKFIVCQSLNEAEIHTTTLSNMKITVILLLQQFNDCVQELQRFTVLVCVVIFCGAAAL